MTLRASLTASQIEAAQAIRRQLRYWQQADSALHRLAQAIPGFDGEAALLKVAAINTLYGTNLYAFQRMAAHVENVLGGKRTELTPELVERIAAIPTLEGQTGRQHVSFASKFCHFFVDAEAFPIYDRFALQSVARHLGRDRAKDPKHPYRAFVTNVQRLIREADLAVTPSELDSYLWIRGAYEAWRKPGARPINAELRTYFERKRNGRLLNRVIGDLR